MGAMTATAFDYIDSDQKLTQFCAQIAGAQWISVDTEFMRERTYYAQLVLIQVASDSVTACIDPVANPNLEPLNSIMQNAECIKIMHSASQDLEVLNQVLGFVPSPLFDTQIAAGFLGAADQISYAGIVKEVLDIELSKGETRTNWLQRPLTPAQIEYAQLDVVYLKQIADQLTSQLIDMGRLAWHQQECETLVRRYQQEDAMGLAWTRIKAVQSMSASEQAIVRVIAAWRETLAQQRDLPREWVLGKQAIAEIARTRPTNVVQLKQIGSLTEKQKKHYATVLLALVRKAENVDSIASALQPLDVHQRQQAKKLMKALRDKAESLSITPALIANRSMVEALVRGERDLALLKTWRGQRGRH